MLRWIARLITGVLAACSFLEAVHAENWPCWRGPRGDGTSIESGIPVAWRPAENIAWKSEVPGEGHASPIVWGDRIFVVSAVTQDMDRVLVALDRRTGQRLWERTVLHSPLEPKHRLNSYASSTPATDGKLVYVTFLDRGDMVVTAYDFDGNQKWMARPGPFKSVHGFCSSPVLYKDKIIINGDHDGDAYLVALDRASGKPIWKVDRENKTRSYCTPIIRDLAGRTQMLLSGSKCVASYDPNDGSRHWIIDGPTEQFVASPVTTHGLVFITGGFPDHHIIAIDPGGSGNITDTNIRWHETTGVSYVPSPIAVGDYFLIVSDDGIASCYQAVSGKRLWRERIGKHFSASLVSGDGLVYFLSDDGIMTVVRPGPQFDRVARNELGEQCFASPALSNGQMFLRSEKHLFAIGTPTTAVGQK